MTDAAPTPDYQPIADYGAIGDLRTIALISRSGSLDWCCMPDLDGPSTFAAVLDARRGGHFSISASPPVRGEQRYLTDTNVLETTFGAAGGRITVTDFMPVAGDLRKRGADGAPSEIWRVIRCDGGRVPVDIEWAPRFDYARATMELRAASGAIVASGGGDCAALAGLPQPASIAETPDGPMALARVTLAPGEVVTLVSRHGTSEPARNAAEWREVLDRTCAAWTTWARAGDGERLVDERWQGQLVRSALVLKLLTHRHTGAIAAAATTSLPEQIGGVRNWDYRYNWLRDAAFTVQALFAMGHRTEAADFIEWTERTATAGGQRTGSLQIMYGLHGETEIPEQILPHLEGYRGSRPVRIGNAAAKQRQLDIYGELLGAAYEVIRLGLPLPADVPTFLAGIADAASTVWREPDSGLWETRGGLKHFVYSKVMIWVALDRAVRMAEKGHLQGDVGRWRRERDAVRAAILAQGYNAKIGAFVQSFGSTALDAANLMIPVVEFLPFDDPRVVGTIAATKRELLRDGLVYRYCTDDGIPGGEGAFGLTTFWLVITLALSGQLDEARSLFEGMAARANHVGLYAEEFDPKTGAFLGNFPQAFTHIGFINAALYLRRAEGAAAPAAPPVGTAEHRRESGHDPGGTTG